MHQHFLHVEFLMLPKGENEKCQHYYCHPLALVSNIETILDASSYFSNEIKQYILRKENACAVEGVYSLASSPATSSMKTLKYTLLISILKDILCNASLDQSCTVTR